MAFTTEQKRARLVEKKRWKNITAASMGEWAYRMTT